MDSLFNFAVTLARAQAASVTDPDPCTHCAGNGPLTPHARGPRTDMLCPQCLQAALWGEADQDRDERRYEGMGAGETYAAITRGE